MTLLFYLAFLILLINFIMLTEIFFGVAKMRNLRHLEPCSQGAPGLPLVSVIVPACNEEQTIEAGLRSLLAQEYENLQIIVINDRSRDATGAVLEQLAARYPQLVVAQVTELPAGWLGKSHALACGAARAAGKYLLFTDADIIMAPSTISRAVACMEAEGLDHLSLFFRNLAPGGLLNAMVLDLGGGLLTIFKPWRVKDPRSKRFMGVGAFNMVRAAVYREVGGHDAIRMHPIDDIMLGKLIKERGFRQECLLGFDFVAVHWYETPRAMVQGLMKNVFALFHFRVWLALLAVLLMIMVNILPLWGLLFTHGAPQLVFLAAVGSRLLIHAVGATAMGGSPRGFLYSLLTPYVSVFIVLKAVLTTVRNGGITWRGTYYPLEQLRKTSAIL